MLREYWNRLRLNFQAARLAAAGVWMSHADVAASNDAIADTYDEHWASRVRSTISFVGLLPWR